MSLESEILKKLDNCGRAFISKIVLHQSLDENDLNKWWAEIIGQPSVKEVSARAPVETTTCQAVYKSGNKKGTRCTTTAQNGQIYCGRHSIKVKPINQVVCKMVLRNGFNCKKPPSKDSEYCSFHAKMGPDQEPMKTEKGKFETKDEGPYIFNPDMLKMDDGEYTRKTKKTWKHNPTNLRVKKKSDNSYVIDAYFDDDENGVETPFELTKDIKITLFNLPVMISEE